MSVPDWRAIHPPGVGLASFRPADVGRRKWNGNEAVNWPAAVIGALGQPHCCSAPVFTGYSALLALPSSSGSFSQARRNGPRRAPVPGTRRLRGSASPPPPSLPAGLSPSAVGFPSRSQRRAEQLVGLSSRLSARTPASPALGLPYCRRGARLRRGRRSSRPRDGSCRCGDSWRRLNALGGGRLRDCSHRLQVLRGALPREEAASAALREAQLWMRDADGPAINAYTSSRAPLRALRRGRQSASAPNGSAPYSAPSFWAASVFAGA